MSADTLPSTVRVTHIRRPQWALAGFVARRTTRTAAVWGVATGLYVYATALGFNTIAATPAQRQILLNGFASNVGLKALLGDTGRIDTVAGFIDWRVIGVMSMATAIWALLAATRNLRGEEAAGRWEIALAGPTQPGAATGRILAGLGTAVAAMWLIITVVTAIVGARHDIGITAGQAAFFGLVTVAAPALFLTVGAVASQLMATRARAAGLSAAVFGASFMLRALGDAAPAAHWLVYASPLGWIEQLRPLGDPHPLWLIPIAAATTALTVAAISLSGRRDLGASIIADHNAAAAHTRMLGNPTLIALRLSRGSITAWLAGTAVAAALYGTFARSAGNAFASSSLLQKFAGGLTSNAQRLGARTYAGVIFLIMMTVLMAHAATAMANVRETEAEGYLDNLLVRRVGRLPWLSGRAAIAAGVVLVGGLLAGAGFWAGAASQHAGLGGHELLLAGINATAPALLLLGAALFTFGFAPRATAITGYAILAWAFLLEMLGSAIHLNHWLMDTSLLHHIPLAPAADPNWHVMATYLTIGIGLAAAGAWRFTRRDLQTG